MRDRMRAFALLLGFSFRAAPAQTWLFLGTQVFGQLASLGSIYGVKLVIDAAVQGEIRAAVTAGLFTALADRVGFIVARHGMYVARELEERVSLLIDQQLMTLSTGIPGIEHHERPEFIDRLERVRDQRVKLTAVMSATAYSLGSGLQLAGSAVLLTTISPWLITLVLLAAATVFAGNRAALIRERAHSSTAQRRRLRRALFELATSPAAGKELRVFAGDGWIADRHRELAAGIVREQSRAGWKSQLAELAGGLVFVSGFIGAVTFVLLRAVSGLATAGDVIMVIRIAAELNGAVATLTGTAVRLAEAVRAAGLFLWLSAYAAKMRVPQANLAHPPRHLARGLAVQQVSFRYPGTDRFVLSDLSVFFPAGTVVAIVGENGSGKSTLVKLLCRFYDPDAGLVTLDGVPIRDFDPAEWRLNVAAGFQDYCRFEFLARETVGVGDLRHINSGEHVDSAVARADAGALTASLPSGLDTQLGRTWERGIDLSGGQWQRLALARSLMRRGPLVTVFDEPTASLDAETEHNLFARFAEASRINRDIGGITVLVSHRYSTVRMADLIVVLDGGRVKESGSHRALVERRGTYASMYRVQARAYVGSRAD